jgi:hypothetical protein
MFEFFCHFLSDYPASLSLSTVVPSSLRMEEWNGMSVKCHGLDG